MDLKQLNFIVFVIIRDLLLPWFTQQPVTYLVDSQLPVGIQVMLTKMTLNHFCFHSIRKPNTLLMTCIISLLSFAIHHSVLHLVMAMTSMYLTTQIRTVAVKSVVAMHTKFPKVLMAIIQYSQTAIKTLDLKNLKYTLYTERRNRSEREDAQIEWARFSFRITDLKIMIRCKMSFMYKCNYNLLSSSE